MLCLLLFLFLFFKQKTAYEMRISDWSSDVCSSDLPSITVPEMLERQLILPSTPHGVRGLVQSLAADHNTSLKIAVESDGSNAITKNLVQAGIGCEIGRAAGRERVGQYV